MTRGARHLTPTELADRLGMAASTLAEWRLKGCGPRFVKFGLTKQARVRYPVAEVEAWEAGLAICSNTGQSCPSDTPATPGDVDGSPQSLIIQQNTAA